MKNPPGTRLFTTFLVLALLLAALTPALPAHAAAAQPAAARSPLSSQSFASYLAPDGSLNLPQGFAGSLDPSGYRMDLGPDGAPRFVVNAPSAPSAPDAVITEPGSENWWGGFNKDGADNLVAAILVDGSNIYIGGDFNTVAGVPAYGVAVWNGSTWSEVGYGIEMGFTRARTLAKVGNTLFAGGQFFNVYSDAQHTIPTPAKNIAQWNMLSGGAWSEVGYGLDDFVATLAVDGTTLYAGGNFLGYYTEGTYNAGLKGTANKVASWNGTTWAQVGYGLTKDGAGGGDVKTLVVDSSHNLYAGGDFSFFYGDATYTIPIDLESQQPFIAYNVAVWNGTTWAEVGFGLGGKVMALALDGSGNLYAGGEFSAAYTDTGSSPYYDRMENQVDARAIAVWNGSGAWSQLLNGLGGSSPLVTCLKYNAGSLYVGGMFETYYNNPVGETTATRIVVYSAGAWSTLGDGVDQAPAAIGISGGSVYVGGFFTSYSIDGWASKIPANHLLRWNGSAWNRVSAGAGVSNANGGSSISTMVFDGSGNLYVGGFFEFAGLVPAKMVAKWDGAAWSEVGFGLNGIVEDLVFDGSGNLYAAGGFTGIFTDSTHNIYSTTPAHYVAKWSSGGGWSEVGYGIKDLGAHAVEFSGGVLYVGGPFVEVYNSDSYTTTDPANGVAQWTGSGPLAEVGFGVQGTVYDLLAFGGALYAGGKISSIYTNSGHTTSSSVINTVKFNGSAWSEVGFGLGMWSDTVYTLAGYGTTLYAGGDFTMGFANADHDLLNGYSYMGQWTGSGAWTDAGNDMTDAVYDLEFTPSGDLYAGGLFGGSFSRWDGAAWISPDTGVWNGIVNAVKCSGGYCYIGGTFDAVASSIKGSSNIARWTARETRLVSGTGLQNFYSATYPVTLNVATQGNIASLVIQRHDTNHASDPYRHGYWWQIEAYDGEGADAVGYTVHLTFTATGYTLNANSTICKFVDPGWACDMSSQNGTTITLNDQPTLSEWVLGEQGTTAADVTGWQALPAASGLNLAWQTVSEAAIAGFNVYRRPAGSAGGLTRLNPALIPAQNPGAAEGSAYAYLDAVLPGLRFEYRLEIVAPDQTTRTLDLQSGLYQVRLPVIR